MIWPCHCRSGRPFGRCCKLVARLPEGEGWLYEPKWDGFRVLLFRDSREWLVRAVKEPEGTSWRDLSAAVSRAP
jgi:hypothetical protein